MEKIGRYQIKSEIGRGGMATVFHAYDPRFERDIAIKVLPKALLHDPQFRVRFDREAKTVALLEHPAIVPVYDFGEEEGQPYIVMRIMSGGSLADRLKNGAFSIEETNRILTRIAQALDVAHAKGIIHRDLKPGNILFDQYGNAYLSDFGIARLKESGATLTGSGIIGTPAYMSPEQVQGEHTIDGRSDIYSLGIIIFQMITGQMPYKADTPGKIMMKHVLDPVPNISEVKSDLPSDTNSVIQKALAKEPDERYSSAMDLALDFEAIAKNISTQQPATALEDAQLPTRKIELEHTKQEALPPISIPESEIAPQIEIPASKRNRVMLGGITGIILIGAILLSIFVISPAINNRQPTEVAAISSSFPTVTSQPSNTPTFTLAPSSTSPVSTNSLQNTDSPESIIVPTNPPTLTPTSTPTETKIPTETAIPITQTPAAPVIGGADKVGFVMDREIWVSNLDGSELTQLTFDGAEKSALQWNPDGETLHYLSGLCIKSINLNQQLENIACFEAVDFLEGFELSPDGEQIAISLDNQLYVVPYTEDLQDVRFRTDLQSMAECEFLAPYTRNAVKDMRWSGDSREIAINIIGAEPNTGRQIDLIQIIDISQCLERPPKLDEFPAQRFTIQDYDDIPVIPSFDWDGQFLFVMNSFIRNDGFGYIYSYNTDRKTGQELAPIEGRCCYRDARWSPDGRMLLFAFQDISLGANSTTVFYYVPFSTITTGAQMVPLDLPELTNPREAPQPALRPAQDQ